MDTEDIHPGQNWKIKITEAIKESDFFIALFSKKSLSRRKRFFHREIYAAIDELMEFSEGEIFIIPVRLDECELKA